VKLVTLPLLKLSLTITHMGAAAVGPYVNPVTVGEAVVGEAVVGEAEGPVGAAVGAAAGMR